MRWAASFSLETAATAPPSHHGRRWLRAKRNYRHCICTSTAIALGLRIAPIQIPWKITKPCGSRRPPGGQRGKRLSHFLHSRKARDCAMLGVILSWVLCGLVIGIIARILVPGRHPLGMLGTILLGVVGAFVGGFLACLFNGSS